MDSQKVLKRGEIEELSILKIDAPEIIYDTSRCVFIDFEETDKFLTVEYIKDGQWFVDKYRISQIESYHVVYAIDEVSEDDFLGKDSVITPLLLPGNVDSKNSKKSRDYGGQSVNLADFWSYIDDGGYRED